MTNIISTNACCTIPVTSVPGTCCSEGGVRDVHALMVVLLVIFGVKMIWDAKQKGKGGKTE
jgi:hypothetical protein